MEHHEAVRTLAAERYLLEEMTDDERDAFEVHYFDCAICADSVRTGAALADGTRRDALSSPVPLAAAVPSRARGPFWSFVPLAAAAALAVVAGYQTFVTVPALRAALDSPRALRPIAVAPASRGEGADVPLDATNGPLLFSLDINVDPLPPQLVYDLRTDAGAVVLSGVAPAPSQGTPLLLLFPGTSLTSGQYAIVVRGSGPSSREVGTYRFVVR
jgi:hypothetical protein